ncbi:Piso0_003482 [Millerozyma farinosa CBS 7064]|uniref:Piso0_003482 protein n=1 Tax=Pichia sorbitophila (strain ATCC MYA-4447 / BCRC 22081 / CBS 7064 / NBRC 10061 / NRRL Y-12695) TaxID=559304 RepID=G8YI79_PICSO|nr:Piso0_003482 [Millerozyma farinosa CBS 7064]CCE81131.1 Piso0_003482 [Millerozyma farinosa CBS 7064]
MKSELRHLPRASSLFLPTSRKDIESELKRSYLFRSIWERKDLNGSNDTLNAPETLAAEVPARWLVFERVANEKKQSNVLLLKFSQWFSFGKVIIKFYKHGGTNIWKNRKHLKHITKEKYKLGGFLNTKGQDIEVKLPAFNELTMEMANRLYLDHIETKAETDNTTGDVVRKDNYIKTNSSNFFSLSRHDYQLIKRTSRDIIKLPVFGLIFLVFMECTPLVCYMIPEITPSTCVLPYFLPKVWNSKSSLQLLEKRADLVDSWEDLALKNAYNLPIDQARLLAKCLRLTSRYIPSFLYPESLVRKRLQSHYCYLCVDNYYLSGQNSEGNVWNLLPQELISACLERNLIPDIKKDLDHISSIKDEAKRNEFLDIYFKTLRVKLMLFIVNFEKFNIGYVGIQNLLEKSYNLEDVNRTVLASLEN